MVSEGGRVQLVQTLVSKYEPRIRRFIHDRSGPGILKRASIDDLFQETAAAAVSSADRFSYVDDARFIGWISTIARRVIARSSSGSARCFPTVRLRGAESSGPGVRETDLHGRGRTPSSLAASEERAVGLRAAMASLSADHRLVLTLYKLEERPLEEVARRMGRTKGATCRLIARAIGQLRHALVE
jgi:RNA polymerase sigma factor (sigma-70 family)